MRGTKRGVSVEPRGEDIGGRKLSGWGVGTGCGWGSGAVYMDGGLESPIATGAIVRRGGRIRV